MHDGFGDELIEEGDVKGSVPSDCAARDSTGRSKSAVDDYFAGVPADVREHLSALRKTIAQAAPQAEELISYKIPAFRFHGMLVWYAAFKNHIGFYPKSSGIKAFERELSAYPYAKGSVRFPLDRPLPLDLISRIVIFRVRENLEKAHAETKN